MKPRAVLPLSASIAVFACGGAVSTGSGNHSGSRGACCPVTLAAGQHVPAALAVDQTGVYWSNGGNASGGSIAKVGLDGGASTTLAPATDPLHIALDAGNVLWTSGGAIWKVAEQGGSPATLIASGPWVATGVAARAGTAYWVAVGDAGGGLVMKVAVAGGTPEMIASLQSPLAQPFAIAVDANEVYWADNGTDAIMKVSLSGGTPITLASDQAYPIAIAVDGASVYWINEDNNTVMKVPLGGGTAVTLASGQKGPHGVAADGSAVYWTDSDGNAVMKLPVGGIQPVTLVSTQFPDAIAVDRTSVYWVGSGTDSGAIMKFTPK